MDLKCAVTSEQLMVAAVGCQNASCPAGMESIFSAASPPILIVSHFPMVCQTKFAIESSQWWHLCNLCTLFPHTDLLKAVLGLVYWC